MDAPQSYFATNTRGLLQLDTELRNYLVEHVTPASTLCRQTLQSMSTNVPSSTAEITLRSIEQMTQALTPNLPEEFTPIKDTFVIFKQQQQQLQELNEKLSQLEEQKTSMTQRKEKLSSLPQELVNKKQTKKTELDNIKNTIAQATTLNAALDLLTTCLNELKNLSPEQKLDVTKELQAIVALKNKKNTENYNQLHSSIEKIVTPSYLEYFFKQEATFVDKRTELAKQLETISQKWRNHIYLGYDEIRVEQELRELQEEIEKTPKDLQYYNNRILDLTQKIKETTEAISLAQTNLETTLKKTHEELTAVQEHFTPRSPLHLQAKGTAYQSVIFYNRWKRGATVICLLSAGFLGLAIAARLGKLTQGLKLLGEQQNFLSRVDQYLSPYVNHFSLFTAGLEPLTFSAMSALPFVLSIGPRLILAEKEETAAFHAFAELLNYKQSLEIETKQAMITYPAVRIWAEANEDMPSAVKRHLQTWIPDVI